MTDKSISFRSNLNSHLSDLIQEVDWHCARTSRLIAGIVSRLAAYTEEGTALAPAVFMCSSISEFVQRAGVGEYVPLSAVIPIDESSAATILKAAAPLCQSNWKVYIERLDNGETCKFGVFCGSMDPSSLTVDQVVLENHEPGFPVIKIVQNAINKVEVRNSAGSRIEFRFNDDIDVFELNSNADIARLSRLITADVASDGEIFSGFIERLLSVAINNSHGTLVAVVPKGLATIPEGLKDVVELSVPVNLFERFKLHLDEGKTAASVSRLQASAELVAGFIGSDGITIFDSEANVRGYRGFVLTNPDDTPASGGARSRAFAAMSALVGGSLIAAFFRSQDGRTALVMPKGGNVDE